MKNGIEVKNLVVRFGDFTAVNDISFTVPRGEIFAFLGPNGAGKTTTIKVLTTILQKTSGDVQIGGISVDTNTDAIRRMFGIVFQDSSLDDDLTAYENMDFHGALYGVPRSERKEKIETLLRLVDLGDRKDNFVRDYSGGMKRRLEIARGLLHEPDILFLDEPTLGLDPQTRNHMWDYIRKLNQEKGMTIFFTTHYMEEAARMATTVAIIDHGVVLTSGAPEALIKESQTGSLEEAFLKLTGKTIRDEQAGSVDQLRNHARAWGRR